MKTVSLICRNKDKDAAKVGRQRKMPQIKQQETPPKKKAKGNGGKLSTIYGVPNNGYKDVKGTEGKNG